MTCPIHPRDLRVSRLAALLLLLGALLGTAGNEAMAAANAVITLQPTSGNEGSTINFSAQGSTGTSFLWTLGEGVCANHSTTYCLFDSDCPTGACRAISSSYTSNQFTFNYTFPRPSVTTPGYRVHLKVISGAETDTELKNIVIHNVAPTARLAGIDISGNPTETEMYAYVDTNVTFHGLGYCESSPLTVCSVNEECPNGVCVTLSADPLGSLYDIAWDTNYTGSFDVNVPNNWSITQRWSTPGDYRIALRARDDDGYNTVTQTYSPLGVAYAEILVHVIPVGPWARISGPTASFFEGDVISFNDISIASASPIIKREWAFNYGGGVFQADRDQCSGGVCRNVPGSSCSVDADCPFLSNLCDPNQPGDCPPDYGQVTRSLATARPFTIALRVTDELGRQNIGTLVVTPLNIEPTASLVVINPGTGGALTPPYNWTEGTPLRFDANGSSCSPGYIAGYAWNWNSDGIEANFESGWMPGDDDPVMTHAFMEDTAHRNPPEPYKIMLRVIDDDHSVSTPSADYVLITLSVADIPPQAHVFGATDLSTSVPEGDDATFLAQDVSGNTDETVLYEWNFDFQTAPSNLVRDECNLVAFACAHFPTVGCATDADCPIRYIGPVSSFETTRDTCNPSTNLCDHHEGIACLDDSYCPVYSGENLFEVDYSWTEIADHYVALRITDDDGFQSVAVHPVSIVDKPPTALITPNGLPLEANEGTYVLLSAQNSSVAPGGRITKFSWDEDYDGTSFAPDYEGAASTCTGGHCSLAAWIGCSDASDCPAGRGTLNWKWDDGLANRKVALCIKDEDDTSACVPGDPSFYILDVRVKNVAPQFDPNSPPSHEVFEGEVYRYCPVVIEPAGRILDPLTFACVAKPAMMECGPAQNPNSGCLEWEVGQADVDCSGNPDVTHKVQMTVRDDDGGLGEISYFVFVKNRNDPPSIDYCPPSGSAVASTDSGAEPYTTFILATDPDQSCGSETLTYYIDDPMEDKCIGTRCFNSGNPCSRDSDCPTGMTIDYSGVFSWRPHATQVGRISVDLCVRDSEGESACCTHEINVVNPDDVAICNAGPDQQLLPGYVCQIGTVVSNPGSRPLTFEWTQIGTSPEEVHLIPDSSTEIPKVCFAASSRGTYKLGLRCDNGWNLSPQDTVDILLANVRPGAVARGPRHAAVGSLVELDASLSGDYNRNDALSSLDWTDYRGVLDTVSEPNPTFIPTEVGEYAFDLMVSDGQLESELASLSMESLELAEEGGKTIIHNALPYATIEPAPFGVAGVDALLNASMSQRRGDIGDLTYQWTYIDGPVLENELNYGVYEDEPYILTFLPPEPGPYSFRLIVSDGQRQSRPTVAVVNVGEEMNEPPTADAGADQSVSMIQVSASPPSSYVKVTLNGSGRDREQAPLLYAWRQISGVPVPLVSEQSAQPTFIAFAPGLYAFELTVTENQANGLSSLADTVTVAVALADNLPPVASIAGLNPQTLTLTVDPGEVVTLNASGSFDQEGDEMEFDWSQTGGPAVVLSDWTGDKPSFVPDIKGVFYSFRLVVWDEPGNPSAPINFRVNVLSESNATPECLLLDAGENVVNELQIPGVVVGDLVPLDGSPTRDLDAADVLSCEWRQLTAELTGEEDLIAGNATLTNGNQKTASVQPTAEGHFAFILLCDDGKETCDPPARVDFTAGPNGKPVAMATPEGASTVNGCKGREVTIDGSHSYDPDEHVLAFAWTIKDQGNTLGLIPQSIEPDLVSSVISFLPNDYGRAVLSLVVSDGFPGGTSEPSLVTVEIAEVCEDGDAEEEEESDTPVRRCVDQDNDEYGNGPDCLGIDPDDYDPCVPVPCLPDGDQATGGDSGCSCRSAAGFDSMFWLAAVAGLWLAIRRKRLKS